MPEATDPKTVDPLITPDSGAGATPEPKQEPKPVVVEKEEVVVEPMRPARLYQNDFAFTTWRVNAFPGTTAEMIENETYWTHVARKFRRGDEISVVTDDFTHFWRCVVVAAGEKFADVQILDEHELKTRDGQIQDLPYKAEWGSPSVLYRVMRGKEVMIDKLDSMDEARMWIKGRSSYKPT